MREARAVALSLLVLLGAVAIVAPATTAGSTEAPGVAATTEARTTNNSSMGDQVSSFMHSSSAQTDEEVESGMWDAAYENASNRTAVVDDRTNNLRSRLAALEAEKQALAEARENGTITEVEYRSRMSAVVGRMAALNRSIDETERQARATGANVSAVEQLRERASNMTGPEVSEIARSFAGGPPEGVGPNARGPPDHAGPPGGETGPPNGTETGPPAGERGPPNGSNGPPGDGPPGNGSGQGPPGDGSDDGAGDRGNGGSGQSGEKGNSGDRGNSGDNGPSGSNGGNGNGERGQGNGGPP